MIAVASVQVALGRLTCRKVHAWRITFFTSLEQCRSVLIGMMSCSPWRARRRSPPPGCCHARRSCSGPPAAASPPLLPRCCRHGGRLPAGIPSARLHGAFKDRSKNRLETRRVCCKRRLPHAVSNTAQAFHCASTQRHSNFSSLAYREQVHCQVAVSMQRAACGATSRRR